MAETYLILVIPYSSDEQATAATKNPKFKLLLRLLNFTIHEEEEGKCSVRSTSLRLTFDLTRFRRATVDRSDEDPAVHNAKPAERDQPVSGPAV
jgi:hypothetical protein